jgi:hypothetical protein
LRSVSKTVEEKSSAADNVLLRKLHTDVEILRLDIEDNLQDPDLSAPLYEQLDELGKKLKLRPIDRKKVWWGWFDKSFRFLGMCFFVK